MVPAWYDLYLVADRAMTIPSSSRLESGIRSPISLSGQAICPNGTWNNVVLRGWL
jgi:hypothetical protein